MAAAAAAAARYSHPSLRLPTPGLRPIRPISNNKTQENTTGRQVVNGGRNPRNKDRALQSEEEESVPPGVLHFYN